MKDKEVCILSTRPLDGALIEKAAFQNIKIDTIPFIEVKKVVSTEVAKHIDLLSNQKATVVFTSVNSVEIVVDTVPVNPLIPDWRIYCIGGATFTLVKKFWPYDHVIAVAKNAGELATTIISNKEKKIYFFCGSKRREELPELLQKENIEIEELVVYDTIETPATIDKTYDAVLFFSPSAANSFFLHNRPAQNTVLFAIGNTTANAIKQFSQNAIIVSDFPAKDQLIDKALKYFEE